MTTESAPTKRIIGLSVMPDIGGGNLLSYYVACMIVIMLATFLPQTQAFLLTEYLKIPESEQGVVSGNLNFWGEIVIIATVGLFGSLSDRLGRRVIMAFGFAVMGIAFYLYPRATDLDELLAFRLIYSAGIAAVSCMIVTVVADYVRDVSRGKASGYLGVMNGLGAMIAAFVLIKLPARFIANGMSPLDAGLATFTIVMAISFATAILMWFGLKKNPPQNSEHKTSVTQMIIEGIRAGRDPGIALAYGASFVARRQPRDCGYVPCALADNTRHGQSGHDSGRCAVEGGDGHRYLIHGCVCRRAGFWHSGRQDKSNIGIDGYVGHCIRRLRRHVLCCGPL